MRVVPESQLAYINPPRTATMSIERMLKRATGNAVRSPSRRYSGHHTVYEPQWEDYHWFVSVRHPYTRAISIWRRVIEHMNLRNRQWKAVLLPDQRGFEQVLLNAAPYVRHYWQNMSCKQFTDAAPRVDSVVHQETLAEDFNKLPRLNSRIKDQRFPVHHVSRDKTAWHTHFTPACIDFVQEVFSRDFEEYGYNRDFEAVKQGEYRA